MNTKLSIAIIVALVGIGILAVLWRVTALPSNIPPSTLTPKVTSTGVNSTGGSTTVTSPISTTNTASSGSAPLILAGQDGASVQVNDFVHNGITIVDSANQGGYLLAGNLGYCVSDPQKCQAATSTDFTVYYNNGPQSFLIALTAEPIGEARLHMEAFLMNALGLSQSQMCNLKYLVSVTRYVNTTYAGKNLGFSFCPGAVTLPQ